MVGVDEYGRPVELSIRTGDRVLLTGPTGKPIIPPMPPTARPRSPKWPAVLKRFLKLHPTCEGCGRKAETAHHVRPFSIFPADELLESNLAAVCIPCHFVCAHGGDWKLYIPDARERLAHNLVGVRAAIASHRHLPT